MDKDGQKRWTVDRQGGQGGQPLTVWRTKKELERILGCSARTIQRRVVKGEIERRHSGSAVLYRVVTKQVDTGGQKGWTPDTSGLSTGQKMTGELYQLVTHLTEQLMASERERGRLEQQVAHLEAELNLRPRRRRVTS